MTAATSGPYLQAALLCEHALREKDDVISIIRVVDRWHVRTPKREPDDPSPSFTLSCTAVVIFKSGDHKGKKLLGLRIHNPSGEASNLAGVPILFEGDDRGVNVVMSLNIAVREEGLYWIEVLLDDSAQTRIPFRVIFEYVVSSSTAAATGP